MESIKKGIENIDQKVDKTILKVKEALNLFDPVIIYPYRGYGNSKKAIVNGRVLEKESIVHVGAKEADTLWNNLYKVFKRYESDEIPKVGLKGVFRGDTKRTYTNEEGYFVFEFEINEEGLDNDWHEGTIEIVDMPFDLDYEKSANFEVLICNEKCDFGIISDVDDTIIKSHATDTFERISTILTKDAQSRTPFEGVKNLYDKLVGSNKRPLFFVSGSEYNLYDLLVKFCDHQKICKAPFLLRDSGTTSKRWFKEDTEKYKLKYIEELFKFYPDLKFILIGDSGQKDPEIYKTVAEKYPGRINALYIRHVDSEKRRRELEKIQEQVKVDFLIMDRSDEALKHSEANGWLDK